MMPPGKQEFTYLKKEVRGIFLRHLKENKQHYVICLRGSAFNMALEFDMAAQGL